MAGDVIIWCNGQRLTDLPFERAIEVMRGSAVLDLVVQRPASNHLYDCPEPMWTRGSSGYDSETSSVVAASPPPPPQPNNPSSSPQHHHDGRMRYPRDDTCNRNARSATTAAHFSRPRLATESPFENVAPNWHEMCIKCISLINIYRISRCATRTDDVPDEIDRRVVYRCRAMCTGYVYRARGFDRAAAPRLSRMPSMNLPSGESPLHINRTALVAISDRSAGRARRIPRGEHPEHTRRTSFVVKSRRRRRPVRTVKTLVPSEFRSLRDRARASEIERTRVINPLFHFRVGFAEYAAPSPCRPAAAVPRRSGRMRIR